MYPQLLHLYGPLWIQSYGVMIVLGVSVTAWFVYHHQQRKQCASDDEFFSVAFWGLCFGILGGRVLFVLAHASEYLASPWEFFFVWEGGFAILGAMIGTSLGVWFALKKDWLRALKLSDIVATYAPIAQCFGRIGCLLAGCCYGKMLDQATWWSVTFSNPACLLPDHLLGIPLYPTQLFLAGASLGIFVVLRILSSRLIGVPGALLSLYFLLESIARISIDFFRADRLIVFESRLCLISKFQCYSFIAALMALAVHVWCLWRKKLK